MFDRLTYLLVHTRLLLFDFFLESLQSGSVRRCTVSLQDLYVPMLGKHIVAMSMTSMLLIAVGIKAHTHRSEALSSFLALHRLHKSFGTSPNSVLSR